MAIWDIKKEVRIAVIPLANTLHSENIYKGILRTFSEKLRGCVHITGIVTEKSKLSIPKNYDAYIILFLTGGTRSIAEHIISKIGNKPIVFAAHPSHNSVASTASAYSHLKKRTVFPIIWRNSKDIERSLDLVASCIALQRIKVLDIGSGKIPKEYKRVIRVFGLRILHAEYNDVLRDVHLDSQELDRILQECKIKEYKAWARKLLSGMLYFIKKENVNAIAIDCFPIIKKYRFSPCPVVSVLLDAGIPAACERDYRSLVLLVVGMLLTEKPCWIANITDVVENKIILSHCTAPTRIAKSFRLENHFESGVPYAISADPAPGVYTIAALDPFCKKLAAAKVQVAEYSGPREGMCRSVAVVELQHPVDISRLVSNHHVLIPGDVVRELRYIASFLGLKFELY